MNAASKDVSNLTSENVSEDEDELDEDEMDELEKDTPGEFLSKSVKNQIYIPLINVVFWRNFMWMCREEFLQVIFFSPK